MMSVKGPDGNSDKTPGLLGSLNSLERIPFPPPPCRMELQQSTPNSDKHKHLLKQEDNLIT